MGMNVGQAEEEDGVISTINTTPLVDVMLVLLIIFLITIPVATHTVPVSLPKEVNQPRLTKPENVNLSVTRDGGVFWNQERLSNAALVERLKTVAVAQPQPEVQIRGDGAAPYEHVGRVVLACQRAGILKIGFITEPPPRG
ncbi:biopolymer transporter ExbD [Azoarcus indigens]|uniref:Outer membrane transport energization protein ExbD n=1 Tax=Azoarcus indigens TaxID=29545 RepID=A0A4R6EEZ1_9RHOO|nr:biopolymer transporter ExbD [Azoarcus indigens]NMG66652.1 biopolymer transporter ExbD [Azoarcus indigens]TDN56842.1 outer membrane transport energization protein ExbD [Azoarcus indigens]